MKGIGGYRSGWGRLLAAPATAIAVAASAVASKGCDDRGGADRMASVVSAREETPGGGDPWAAERWVEKAVRVFGDGRVVSPAEARELARRPREEVLGSLLAHEASARSMFRLFLAAQGKVVDSVTRGPELDSELLASHPAAAHAAVAFAQGGDVEVLFDFAQPLVVAGWAEPPRTPEEANLPAHEVRKRGLADVRAKATALKRVLFADRDAGLAETASCGRRRAESTEAYFGLLEVFARLRLPHENALIDSWFPSLYLCAFADTADAVPPTWRQVEGGFARAERGLGALEAFSLRAPAATTDLARASVLKPEDLGVDALNASALSRFGFYIDNPNSSTNGNRRRAATFLDRYLCDSLSPVGGASLAEHPRDGHASEPACQSCHARLDPVAGLFRDIGALGIDFAGRGGLLFDDLAAYRGEELERHRSQWKAPAGSGRVWNTGLMRSRGDPSLNVFADDLPSFHRALRGSPLVKACFVRRVAAWVIGEGVELDRGWLDWLLARYEAERRAGSANAAFKGLLLRLGTSASFVERDPRPGVCYDEVPSTPAGRATGAREWTRANAPPCAVASLLRSHCVGCHGASSPSAGLDLSTWDGGGFAHHDADGARLARRDSFARIADALETSDPRRRMPLGGHLDAMDRVSLHSWFRARIEEEDPK